MNVTFKTLHKNKSGKDEWLTPPEIIKALGDFDLDPCSPINRPWDTADAILFIKGRIKFYHVNGERGGQPGIGSVLIAYGKENSLSLKKSNIEGKYLQLK